MTHGQPGSSLTGKTALVTGANHGIGRATAELLAEAGAKVLITYLRTDVSADNPAAYRENRRMSGHDVANELCKKGLSAIATEADLLNAEAIPHLFDEAEQHFGPVEILINNATGHCANDSFANTQPTGGRDSRVVTAEVIDKTFGVDARASALLIAEFGRRHIERRGDWGRIVGLTSGGSLGFPGEVTYGAAKAALENYAMSAALELGPHGITSNVVHPPVTDTGWVNDDVRDFVEQSADHFRVAEPIEVARVIAFLCAEDADALTGNILRMR